MNRLEKHYKDMQDMEFRIEGKGDLYPSEAHGQADGGGGGSKLP